MENLTLLDTYLYITMSIKSLSMTFQLVHKYQPLYGDVFKFSSNREMVEATFKKPASKYL